MAYVVTAPCFGCKYTDCVVVCPCDCFHEGDQMLYIDPDQCVDCDACRAECPVQAIFPDWEVPAQWQSFIQLNAEMAPRTPSITQKKAPLVGASRARSPHGS
jgi:ferredoxin